MYLYVWFPILLIYALLGPSQFVTSVSPTVTISSGVVVGISTAVHKVVVNKYLGIPFAASPPKRFSPPEPPEPWSTPFSAVSFKDTCIQQFNYPEPSRNFSMTILNPGEPAESEDCLYLNVFTPARATPASGFAVMFWIYGGNLQSGTSTYSFYDGSSFAANQDVIIVTVNYRTNVFGFPGSPQLNVNAKNLGFLDQRFALQWVQHNIRQFGGDPNKVTIFGQSAGGYSVKHLVATPPVPLTFRAAIMESEAALLSGSDGAVSWSSLVAAVNCTVAASPIDCVRAVPATTIQTAIEVAALIFPPVVDNITFTGNVSLAITSRTAAHVPMLFGSNAQEGRLFAYAESLDAPLTVPSFLNVTFPGLTALQMAIIEAYPESIYPTAYLAISVIYTDFLFTCPISAIVKVALDSGYDVWRYFFNASFPNQQLFPDAGVFHSSEIALVFGTYDDVLVDVPPTTQEMALSSYMQTAWADFAKHPYKGPGWPQLDAKGYLVLGDLGPNGTDGETTIKQATVDYNCQLWAAVIAAEGL